MNTFTRQKQSKRTRCSRDADQAAKGRGLLGKGEHRILETGEGLDRDLTSWMPEMGVICRRQNKETKHSFSPSP